MIAVYLTPPKSPLTPERGITNGLVVSNPKSQESNGSEVKEQLPVITETETAPQREKKTHAIEVNSKETLYAKTESPKETGCCVEEVIAEEKATTQVTQLAQRRNFKLR